MFAEPKKLAAQESCSVWQTPPEDCGNTAAGPICSNYLVCGNLRKNASLMSISTIAAEESEPSIRHVGSSNSVSSLERVQENNGSEPEIKGFSVPPGVWNQQAPMFHAPKTSRHCHVPRTVNLAEEHAKTEARPVTTLMIRNVPNRYCQLDLMNELKSLGLGGTFDFLYLPLDLGTMCTVGYAFVNFTTTAAAQKCMGLMQNYRFKRHRQKGKVAAVSAAHIQGLDANLKHYEKSVVSSSRLRQRRPVIVANMSSLIS